MQIPASPSELIALAKLGIERHPFLNEMIRPKDYAG